MIVGRTANSEQTEYLFISIHTVFSSLFTFMFHLYGLAVTAMRVHLVRLFISFNSYRSRVRIERASFSSVFFFHLLFFGELCYKQIDLKIWREKKYQQDLKLSYNFCMAILSICSTILMAFSVWITHFVIKLRVIEITAIIFA